MDVVVKSRHCNVSDQFRSYVDEKITRLEKLNDRAIRVEVEVSAERNKRQHDQASRVEITLRTKGPVIRAEAAGQGCGVRSGAGQADGAAPQGGRPQAGASRPALTPLAARRGG